VRLMFKLSVPRERRVVNYIKTYHRDTEDTEKNNLQKVPKVN